MPVCYAPGTKRRRTSLADAGEHPKVYEPADGTLTLSVPPRQYELVGEILADAVAGDPSDARAAAERHAADVGRKIGAAHRDPAAPDVADAPTDDVSAVYATLDRSRLRTAPGNDRRTVARQLPLPRSCRAAPGAGLRPERGADIRGPRRTRRGRVVRAPTTRSRFLLRPGRSGRGQGLVAAGDG